MPGTYIIIPAYNEGAVLRTTVEPLLQLDAVIVIVDDGSAVPQETFLAGLPVHVLTHPVNLGQGAALQTGMLYARLHDADAVIHFDADGQHDHRDIPRFLATLANGADVAIGSRFLRQQDLALVPRRKQLVLRLARIINGLFTGLWLSDAHNGFRALGKHALAVIDLKENRMAHATEILSQIRRYRLSVTELPVAIRYTAYSQAKGQHLSNAFNILIDLILDKLL